MKIALLISGPSRSLHHIVKSWNFLNQVTDVYAYMRDAEGDERNVWNTFPRASVIYDRDKPELHRWVSGRHMDVRPYYKHAPGVILGLCYWMRLQAFRMIYDPEDYDLIMYVRPDSWLVTPLPLANLTPNKLWTPKYHVWGGINDRIAVGSPDDMRIWSEMYYHLNDDVDTLKCANMESRLANWLIKSKVPLGLIDCDSYFVATDGTHKAIEKDNYGMYSHFPELAGLECR